MKLDDSDQLDPGNHKEYEFKPYPVSALIFDQNVHLLHSLFLSQFGMDPIWQLAINKIEFLNSYKMKISIIIGLFHMMFGLMLSLANKLIKKEYPDIFLEFVPQVMFLLCIFFYLVFMIFFKWIAYAADNDKPHNIYSEHCAPNILITFINMMLFKEDAGDPDLQKACEGRQVYMYPGQKQIQTVLVLLGVLMVPIMLFGKPLYIHLGEW